MLLFIVIFMAEGKCSAVQNKTPLWYAIGVAV